MSAYTPSRGHSRSVWANRSRIRGHVAAWDGVAVERSWTGAAKDALRLLNIIPLAGVVSKVSKVLLITQEAER